MGKLQWPTVGKAGTVGFGASMSDTGSKEQLSLAKKPRRSGSSSFSRQAGPCMVVLHHCLDRGYSLDFDAIEWSVLPPLAF